MSRENVELVQEALGRTAPTGVPPWDVLHEDIEVRDHDILDASEYRGHAGFAHWLEDWSSAWSEPRSRRRARRHGRRTPPFLPKIGSR
jgi:hypothetical protein